MSKLLYIEGKLIDLDQKTVVAMTYQSNDIGELRDIKANYSNTFTFPKTPTNQSALNIADKINSLTEKPYKKLAARYVQNGVELVPNGFIIIEEAGRRYKGTIYSGTVNFFDKIDKKYIGDLELSAYDHTWNLTNAVNSVANITGYIYAYINYGYQNSRGGFYDIRWGLPSFYAHTIFNKIATEAGFSFAGEVLTDTIFLNTVLPFSNDKLAIGSSFVSNREIIIGATPRSYVTGILQLDIATFDPLGFLDVPNYRIKTIGEYFTATINVTINASMSEAGQGHFYLRTNVGGAADLDKFTIIASGAVTEEFTLTAEISHIATDINTYSDIKYHIDVASQTVGGGIGGTIIANSCVLKFEDVKRYIAPGFNETYEVAPNLPKISQKDFLKTIAFQHGLIFSVNNSVITVKKFQDIYNNIPIAKDWSNLLDESEEDSITYRLNYAQINNFKYKEDESVTKGTGDGSLIIADEILPGEKDIVTLPFAASEKNANNSALHFVKIDKFNTNGVDIDKKTQPRILLVDRLSGVAGSYTDGATITAVSQYPGTRFIDTTKAQNLGFNDSLLDDNYSGLAQILDKSKVLVKKFKLSEMHVAGFDHTIPVYIKKYAACFFVQSIDNFVDGKTTKCTLVKL